MSKRQLLVELILLAAFLLLVFVGTMKSAGGLDFWTISTTVAAIAWVALAARLVFRNFVAPLERTLKELDELADRTLARQARQLQEQELQELLASIQLLDINTKHLATQVRVAGDMVNLAAHADGTSNVLPLDEVAVFLQELDSAAQKAARASQDIYDRDALVEQARALSKSVQTFTLLQGVTGPGDLPAETSAARGKLKLVGIGRKGDD
jgi:methyl-accepting chemotaxis protein